MTPLVITRDARAEIAEARRWYERQRTGRGQKFFDRVNEAIGAIRRSPSPHFRIEDRNSRLCLVRGFPYAILYRVEPRRVVIFTVIHSHRDPEIWIP